MSNPSQSIAHEKAAAAWRAMYADRKSRRRTSLGAYARRHIVVVDADFEEYPMHATKGPRAQHADKARPFSFVAQNQIGAGQRSFFTASAPAPVTDGEREYLRSGKRECQRRVRRMRS